MNQIKAMVAEERDNIGDKSYNQIEGYKLDWGVIRKSTKISYMLTVDLSHRLMTSKVIKRLEKLGWKMFNISCPNNQLEVKFTKVVKLLKPMSKEDVGFMKLKNYFRNCDVRNTTKLTEFHNNYEDDEILEQVVCDYCSGETYMLRE